MIMYRDARAKLDALKKDFPQAFSNRLLFTEVQRLFELYTFKLSARREISGLFSEMARLKDTSDINVDADEDLTPIDASSGSPICTLSTNQTVQFVETDSKSLPTLTRSRSWDQ